MSTKILCLNYGSFVGIRNEDPPYHSGAHCSTTAGCHVDGAAWGHLLKEATILNVKGSVQSVLFISVNLNLEDEMRMQTLGLS